MGQLHRGDHLVDDQRRPQAGAETEEEHAASFVASQGLHRGVVDQLRRLAECARRNRSRPSRAPSCAAPTRPCRARPARDSRSSRRRSSSPSSAASNCSTIWLGVSVDARGKAACFRLARGEKLDVRAADVDRQDFLHGRSIQRCVEEPKATVVGTEPAAHQHTLPEDRRTFVDPVVRRHPYSKVDE